LKLGIGVTTYNRSVLLRETLASIRRFTTTAHDLVVADDGSTDDTRESLRAEQVPHIAGRNRGVAWNKNRALFYLKRVRRCDVVILLEDDTRPRAAGWELPWIEAAHRWGHANFAGPWFSELFISGSGTPSNPVLCGSTSGQCSCFSSDALETVGFMDTRFGRYGYEHAEHSHRMLRAGYGGTAAPDLYYLIASDLEVIWDDNEANRRDLVENERIFHDIVGPDATALRPPWRSSREKRDLLTEMVGASFVPGGRGGMVARLALLEVAERLRRSKLLSRRHRTRAATRRKLG
jgi:glycosyltransferase involved in cell wall biosynthesis